MRALKWRPVSELNHLPTNLAPDWFSRLLAMTAPPEGSAFHPDQKGHSLLFLQEYKFQEK